MTGAKQLGESGYWTLTTLAPPEPTPAMKAGNKASVDEHNSFLEPPVAMEVCITILS